MNVRKDWPEIILAAGRSACEDQTAAADGPSAAESWCIAAGHVGGLFHRRAEHECGTVFAFRNRRAAAVKVLAYDGFDSPVFATGVTGLRAIRSLICQAEKSLAV